ncbi:MAG: regulatory protein GemA [Pseudomonadota bacterium]|nr:regulatory protein GemA [Pseudomonadota bacterium]
MSRNPTLAKIHIAKKELGMDDDTYREMLRTHGGVSSSKDLTLIGAAKVMAHLEKCGFKPKAATAAGRSLPKVAPARQPLMGKIEALLADAARPWVYADGVAKRLFASTTKVERIEFCDVEHLMKVVAALTIDAKRRAKKARAAAGAEQSHG